MVSKENVEDEFAHYDFRLETLIIVSYSIFILIIGLTGNTLLLLAINKFKNYKNTFTIYILSFVVSDLILLLVRIPLWGAKGILGYWPFGQILCKFQGFLVNFSYTVSSLTLTCLIVQIYIILYSKNTNTKNVKMTLITIALIYTFSFLFAIPAYRQTNLLTKPIERCIQHPHKERQKLYVRTLESIRFFINFALPIIVSMFLLIFHVVRIKRSQDTVQPIKKYLDTTKVLIILLYVFIICLTPRNIINIFFHFNPYYSLAWHISTGIAICLHLLYFGIKPLVIYCLDVNYRKQINRILTCGSGDEINYREHSLSGENVEMDKT